MIKKRSLSITQAANRYGVTTDRIRQTIARHDDFPYSHIPEINGRQSYIFDPEKVEEWLLKNDWYSISSEKTPPIPDELISESKILHERVVEPKGPRGKYKKTLEKELELEIQKENLSKENKELYIAHQSGEKSVPPIIENLRKKIAEKEGKAEVQTKLLQLEYDKKMEKLVDREAVIMMLSTKMAALAKQLEMLPNILGRKFEFSDDIIREVRDYLDEARRAMVNNDDGFFGIKPIDADET